VVEGQCVLGGQNHFPMEKHSCYVVPENGKYTVYASTQTPDFAHMVAGLVLGVPKNKITLVLKRGGGGFGSKLTGNFSVVMAACLGTAFTGAPVKMQFTIGVDMQLGGNCRHPMIADYKMGCDADGKIQAYQMNAKVDAGVGNDFTGFVCGEVVGNVDSVYAIPNIDSKVTPVMSNTPSNTAMRAPGLVQATLITEQAIDALAAKHGMDSSEMRIKNLMTQETAGTLEGGRILDYTAGNIVEQLKAKCDFDLRKAEVAAFNAEHKWKKRGIEIQPLRYSCTHAFGAGTTVLVNVDSMSGGVTTFHTGAEVGQGINAKLAGAIAGAFGIDASTVEVMETNTSVTPNAMITGGSVTSECVVGAGLDACKQLLERLAPLRQFMTDFDGENIPDDRFGPGNAFISAGQLGALKATGAAGNAPTWAQLCMFANGSFMPFDMHVNLSCAGHYVVEMRNNLDFLTTPFAPGNTTCGFKVGHGLADYISCGAAVTEVEIDCLTGAKTILRSDIIQDCGNSLNAQIDLGQSEGAFVQGLGFVLQEEVLIGATDGKNNSSDTWEYKPPLNGDIPRVFNMELLGQAPKNEAGLPYVKGSKAVGEPPLMAAISALSAVRSAVRASRVERGLSPEFNLQSPATVDRIQQALEINVAGELGDALVK